MLTTLLAALPLLATPPVLSPSLPEEEPKPLDRIVLIGASVTAGFGLPNELNAKASLVEFIDTALSVPHQKIENFGSTMLFSNPIELGEKQIGKALAEKPTLIVAADFPFWFGYGHWRNRGGREHGLEQGLKLLERIECPLVVGDFPDMSAALKGTTGLTGGGPMVSPAQIPSAEERAKLNARLREWVASRENVYLFEMTRFVESMHDKAPFELRGNTIDAKAKEALLQPCLLHPTVKGTCAFTVLLLDTLVRAEIVPAEAVVWDMKKLEEGVWKATEKDRQHRLERERRREERKKELEEKKREKEEEGGGDGEQQPRLLCIAR